MAKIYENFANWQAGDGSKNYHEAAEKLKKIKIANVTDKEGLLAIVREAMGKDSTARIETRHYLHIEGKNYVITAKVEGLNKEE